ncbi:hypothetical protein L195_g037969 [Trifolium pratense]|uniref:Uncharacterized protein n=1 Tax=Trifolium pratense TaxID=57577 RepID=A0A2K3LTS9_TRIPR|nr:hypothetical protein L195_g037969 [Trifolium pratense]
MIPAPAPVALEAPSTKIVHLTAPSTAGARHLCDEVG